MVLVACLLISATKNSSSASGTVFCEPRRAISQLLRLTNFAYYAAEGVRMPDRLGLFLRARQN